MRSLFILLMFIMSISASYSKERRLDMETYRDKVKAAWIGKMAGVGWGITTEFRYSHRIVPDSLLYDWSASMVNEGFNQDDIYLSAFFLSLIDRYGVDVEARTAVLEKQNMEFEYGRRNSLVNEGGIAPPDLAHPYYKKTSDGCGYTCGADYSGLMAPGLAAVPVHYGDVFGSGIGYGDGIYGGVFIGAMYCEAFFTEDMHHIIAEALKSIPSKSLVYQAVNDVVKWHRKNPSDWKSTWHDIMDKYWWNEDNNWIEWPYGGKQKGINLDSKSMCAFTVMALLYGEGDLEKTMRIAVQASEDADCDASIASGILCASLGMKAIDKKFYSSLDHEMFVKYLPYTFDGLLVLTENVARKVVPVYGGRFEIIDGKEYIIVATAGIDNNKNKYISSKHPAPIKGERFTEEELSTLELVSDTGFENQSSVWSFFLDNGANHILPVEFDGRVESGYAKQARTGLADARISLWYKNGYRRSGSKIFAGIRQIVSLNGHSHYRLLCWVRTEGKFVQKGRLIVKTIDGKVIKEVVFGDKPEWTKVGFVFEAGTMEHVVVEAGFLGTNESRMTCRFDDFSIKSVQ